MSFKSLESALSVNSIGRKKFSDIGVFSGVESDRIKLVYCSRDILRKVISYSNFLKNKGIPCVILAEVDDSKMFWLDKLYFCYYPVGIKFEVLIDLKGSINYTLLSDCLLKSGGSSLVSYIDLYKKFWSDALYCAFLETSVDCDEFVWEMLW